MLRVAACEPCSGSEGWLPPHGCGGKDVILEEFLLRGGGKKGWVKESVLG